MQKLDLLKRLSLYVFLAVGIVFTGCDDDDDAAPAPENELEVITDVKLIFTPQGGGTPVEVTAKDPDGEGVQEFEVSGSITLTAGTTYTLTYEILNALDPDDVEDIGEEIAEEDDEHQFFFAFTDGAFTSPTGNGNIDGNTTGTEAINYNDTDGNGNPLGLNTTWTVGAATTGANFTVRLQHQPDVKTATSGATDGETDFNLSFELNIQ